MTPYPIYPNLPNRRSPPPPSIPHNLQKVPARVDVVNLDGVRRTKDDYVKAHLDPVFKASNFEELLKCSTEVQKQLQSLGCFTKVGVLIDTNKGTDASPDGYVVTFMAEELGRLKGSVTTLAGHNEGSVILALKLPNVIGRGEKIACEHTISTIHDWGSSLAFSKPMVWPWNSEMTAKIFRQKYTNTFSSYNLRQTGGLLDYTFKSAKGTQYGGIQWEGDWRQLKATSGSTSMAVRDQSGQSFKSAIRYLITLDSRDQPIFPTTGILMKFVEEFAGVGGDTAYVKIDTHLQVNVQLPFDMVLQGGFRLGLLHSLSKPSTLNIHDLFFLGGPCGPTTLRGFEMKGIGPKCGHDDLGGQAYWSSGLHLFGPLPFRLGRGSFGDSFRTHFFLNAGNITEKSIIGAQNSGASLLRNYRASCGFGLAMNIGQLARLEINYCWPLKYFKGDRIVPGVQFGVGLEF